MEELTFLGSKVFESGDFTELIIKFIINLIFTITIVRYIYYKTPKDKEFLFSILALNIAIFFICHLLSDTKIKTGFAFGLFAIFSILRYRTEVIPIKTMTFLFIAITIGVLNSMTGKKVSWAEIIAANLIITAVAFVLENLWLNHNEAKQVIVYEKIENITPENEHILIADLKERTGKDVIRVEVTNINFLKDTCEVVMHYNIN